MVDGEWLSVVFNGQWFVIVALLMVKLMANFWSMVVHGLLDD